MNINIAANIADASNIAASEFAKFDGVVSVDVKFLSVSGLVLTATFAPGGLLISVR